MEENKHKVIADEEGLGDDKLVACDCEIFRRFYYSMRTDYIELHIRTDVTGGLTASNEETIALSKPQIKELLSELNAALHEFGERH